ncbi:MAG: polyphosphate polymerase domain-containing protein [Oscillospiraceae bacterium]|jgi:hypothetical protein|nr:polyphosphate polymerase domain-containing protein [Oscillospiraceae bacterium]
MRYRHEHKYILSAQTAELLRERVRAVLRPDRHSGGAYEVCNIYFDDQTDSFYQEKALGGFRRDKYRLRWYNGDLSFIRLERKHKDGSLSYKDTISLTQTQAQSFLAGSFPMPGEAPLLQRLALLHRLHRLRPAAAFAYRREAYVYAPGDVRLTFDGHPYPLGATPPDGRSSFPGFADAYARLLEVKFSGFMPGAVAGLFRGLPLARTEMSKYGLVRERGLTVHESAPRYAHTAG